MMNSPVRRVLMAGVALAVLTACGEPLDFDLRSIANGFDTTGAVQELPGRPRPDDRGVISYPTYQVVIARQDDTIRSIAIRLGLDVDELAEYNGIDPDIALRRDEVIALPTRVDEPSPATGADGTGPIQPLDVTAVATTALDRADGQTSVAATPLAPATSAPAAQTGAEPIRHQVKAGETVYSISRLYNVPVRAVAEWNGLNAEFTIRVGQYLLIPQAAAPAPSTQISSPGTGTATPVPPSAATPLPVVTPVVPTPVITQVPTPDVGETTTTSTARLINPVDGPIIRAYAAGRNEGIDIGVPAGTPVKVADAGTVAAVTTNTSGVAIVVVKHADGLLTVYTNIDQLTIDKGDTVSRGQTIGKVLAGDPSFLHFEVRRGLQSVDPTDYLP